MDKKEFYDFMLEFFNMKDVRKLEEYAIELAKDAHEGTEGEIDRLIGESDRKRFLERAGREFLLDQIQFGEITFTDIEDVIGHPIDEETRKSMEWRF